MKLNTARFFAICIFCFSFTLPVFFAGSAFARAQKEKGLAGGAISISSSQKGFFAPDTVELVLSVDTTGKSVVLAAAGNAAGAQALVGRLEGMVNGAGDYIKTSRYSVKPVYQWDEKQKKNTLAGYRVTNRVLVRTHQTDMVGRIIDQGLTAGANRIFLSSVNFTLGKQSAYCGGLIAKAAVNAKQQAQALATALGVKLGKIKSASPSCGQVGSTRFSMMAARAQALAKTPVEAGEIELKATVNIVFRIE